MESLHLRKHFEKKCFCFFLKISPYLLNEPRIYIYIYNVCLHLCMYTTPSPRAGCVTRSVFKRRKAVFNSEWMLPSSKLVAYRVQSALLFIRWARKNRRIQDFPREFAWSETQAASSRNWIRVADSIPYEDNHFAKLTLGLRMHGKGDTTLSRALELESSHRMQFSVIPRTPIFLNNRYAKCDILYRNCMRKEWLQRW